MISIPTAEQQAFQGSSPKNLILNFPVGRTLTNENIFTESMSLEQTICDESNFTFGLVYSTCFTVKIFDDGLSYTGLAVNPQISVTEEDGTTYTRNLGQFTVKSDTLTSDKIYRDLKCYDALSDVLSFDYADWHNNGMGASFTLKQYRDSFFDYIGIPQVSVTLPNDSVQLTKFKVEKVSGAEILSSILQLNGAMGYIGYDGRFKYVFPKTTVDYTIEDNSYVQGSFDYQDEPMIAVTGVKVKGYSNDYGEEETVSVADVSAGNETGSVVSIENNYLIQTATEATRQTICNALYSVLNGFTYYPSSIDVPAYVGLELGDVFQVVTERKTVTFPVLHRTLNGISALRDSLEAKGEGKIESNANSVSGSVNSTAVAINQMRLSVAQLLARRASIDDLVASNGRITNLESANVTVNNTLTAHKGLIDNLEANKATVVDLKAAQADITELETGYAHISELDTGYANIKTLLAGQAGVGDLQSIHLTALNSVVDEAVIKNLVSRYISVSDLMAGNISTNKFNIVSDDGAIKIDGSTQTFKDANGNVRIQMGQDATGNFTFVLYDATGQGILLDSTGIKESAIADGLIKNAKIANDANISATKLDIASLFDVINNESNYTIYSNRIWFDDKRQTLNQIYSEMSSDISDADTKATDAKSLAQTASDNANAAIRAIEGISSLDNVTAVLSNDSHVVHTDYDGTGGNYTYANTVVSAYKGDADISSQVTITHAKSSGLTGTWDATSRTFQVTGLTSDNGYVDFTVSYTPQNGSAVTVTKRFSISKAPDGRAGSAYNLQTSAVIMQKTTEGVFNPSSITFSAIVAIGSQSNLYSGKYKIEESVDGSTWVQKYLSPSVELSKDYIPTSTAEYIRCTLMDENNVYLDSQTITVIADSAEISDSVDSAKEAVMNLGTRVGTVESGIEGLRVGLSETNEEIHGVSDNTLLYQPVTDYTDNDIVTVRAMVYKAGKDVHTDYPSEWFSWHKKDEEGMICVGTGYAMQVKKSDYEFSGTLVGRFTTFNEDYLIFPNGQEVIFPDGEYAKVYYQ